MAERRPLKISLRQLQLLAGAIVALVLTIVLYRAEWVEVTVSEGYSLEALKNPFLAAQKFLAAQEIEVQQISSLRGLETLPDLEDSLLITSGRLGFGAAREERLLQWVSEGGHLMLVASAIWDAEREQSGDRLLDRLGIQLYRAEIDDQDGLRRLVEKVVEVAPPPEDDTGTGELARVLYCSQANQAAEVTFEDEDETLLAAFPHASFIYYEGEDALGWASNDIGTQLLRLAVGEGDVTVVTSMGLWRNPRIECFDNAHVLAGLVQGKRLHWLQHVEMPSLPKLLWQRFPLLLLSLALLLVFWVWRSSTRFGVVLHADTQTRRQLLEHASQVARFLWQQRQEGELIDSLRQEIFKRQKHLTGGGSGKFTQAEEQELAHLALDSGLSTAEAKRALYGSPAHRRDNFKRIIRLLQKLANSTGN